MFGLISQDNADQIGSLFVTKFYNTLIDENEDLSTLYASNATINYKTQEMKVQDGIKVYVDEKLTEGNFDFSHNNLICTPTFACGVNVSIKGTVKRENEGKETVTDITHKFLLMPIRSGKLDLTYLILNDTLFLGKQKVVTKKEAPKRKPAVEKPKPTKSKPVSQDKGAKEFSYAKAAATTPKEGTAPVAPAASSNTPAQKPVHPKKHGHGQDVKYKIRVKKIPGEAPDELLEKAFAETFGPVAEVKRLYPSVAVIRFETITTVENILSKPVRERVLKLEYEGNVEVLDLWAERPWVPKKQTKA